MVALRRSAAVARSDKSRRERISDDRRADLCGSVACPFQPNTRQADTRSHPRGACRLAVLWTWPRRIARAFPDACGGVFAADQLPGGQSTPDITRRDAPDRRMAADHREFQLSVRADRGR